EYFQCERPAVFLDFMNLFLKFRKHRLTEESLSDIFDLAIDKIGAHLHVVRSFQEIVRKQCLTSGFCVAKSLKSVNPVNPGVPDSGTCRAATGIRGRFDW